jgi:hypothetical protein
MMGIPFPPKILNLGNRDSRSDRNSMSLAPNLHVGLVPERQNGSAKVVNVVPCCSRRNGKMHPEIFLLDLALYDVDIDVFHLAAKSGVDHRVPCDPCMRRATDRDLHRGVLRFQVFNEREISNFFTTRRQRELACVRGLAARRPTVAWSVKLRPHDCSENCYYHRRSAICCSTNFATMAFRCVVG